MPHCFIQGTWVSVESWKQTSVDAEQQLCGVIKESPMLGLVVLIYKLNTQEVEAGGS